MPAKNWRWHDLKKSFALFPVARVGFASAAFLRPHYARRAEERPWARRALDGMVGSAFRLWVGRRARAVAARWGLGDEWAGRAAEIGRDRFADPLDGKLSSKSRKMLRERILQSAVLFSARPFFLSDEFSLVACSIAPILWRLPLYGIEFGARGEPIEAYLKRVFARRSFRQSAQSRQGRARR